MPIPGVPERQYSNLTAGSDGTVFYLEASRNPPTPGLPGGSELMRYRLSDRKAAPFLQYVAAYNVSADGKKLVAVSGTASGGGQPARRGPTPPIAVHDAAFGVSRH